MDTLSIFIKTLTYILIGTLVRVFLPRLINTRKPKEDTQGIEYFDKKGFSWVFLVSAIGFTIPYAFYLAFPGESGGFVASLIIGGVCVLVYLLSLSYGLWYILITPDRIEFRNHYGIKRVITKDNVLKVLETPTGRLKVYLKDKKKTTFEQDFAFYASIWFSDNQIRTGYKADINSFTVREYLPPRILTASFAVFCLGFTVLAVCYDMYIGCVIFGGLAALFIWVYYKACSTRLTFKNNMIIYRTIYVRRRINFNEVACIKTEKIDDSTDSVNIYLKNEKEPFEKLSCNAVNMNILMSLANQNGWIKRRKHK